MNVSDLLSVYEQLRESFEIELTNTFALDVGFEEDFPIICGASGELKFWLYEYAGDFVFSVEIPGDKDHPHWHPQSVEDAVSDVRKFMEGKFVCRTVTIGGVTYCVAECEE